MPSPLGPLDNRCEPVAGSALSNQRSARTRPSTQRCAWPDEDDDQRTQSSAPPHDESDLAVELPSSPPVLTPGAARVLVRVLRKASRARSDGTVHPEGETEVLAS
jgi:hypothetical protein